jgi:hypothetical protein
MGYCGFVTTLVNVRKHPNADKLQLADCLGNTTCVGLNAREGDLTLYFPTDGQLSLDFCIKNHLLRKLPDGTPDTGYLEHDKRHVKTIRLRGEPSDGIAMPLTALEPFGDISTLSVGDRIDIFNGVEICRKYIPRGQKYRGGAGGNRTRKAKVPTAPLFAEHADTEQLNYNLDAFKSGDLVEITLKMHGTSQRTGYLPVLKGYKKTLIDRILRREGEPIYDWGYVTGTRRTVLDDYDGGYYGSNAFREAHSKVFEGKLLKGETVYYEVVGFTDTGVPIMSECNNAKTNDPEFIKRYGDTTVFSYGCSPTGSEEIDSPMLESVGTLIIGDTSLTVNGMKAYKEIPQSDLYVYRMTMTNEDGDVVEYTPDQVRYRCEQMGVKSVPLLWREIIPENPATWYDSTVSAGEFIKCVAEGYYDGPDPIGKTHVREGVVVRIVNRPKFTAYKTKNLSFKILEGIAKAEADAPDIEEAQEIVENDE